MSPSDEGFDLGIKVGGILGFIVGFGLACLMCSTTNSEDDKTTQCHCICAMETEEDDA